MFKAYEISTYWNNNFKPVLTANNTKEYFEEFFGIEINGTAQTTVKSFYITDVWKETPTHHDVTFIITEEDIQ